MENLIEAFEQFLDRKQRLINTSKDLEYQIIFWSSRDRIRMVELEKELHKVNMELLEVMTNEITKAA